MAGPDTSTAREDADRTPSPFAQYEVGSRFYDEMFEEDGRPREACRRMRDMLAGLAPEDLAKLQESVYRRFLHEGITFTVLGGDEVTERIIPLDFVPRVLTGAEWDHIERGLKQRLAALNLFLKDVYHEGRSLRDRIVPMDLVLGCPQYRMEMRGIKVPHDVYVAVCGTDIVRTGDGFAVLEDNLRVPSGVSYMLGCRDAVKSAFPSSTGSIGYGRSPSTASACTRSWPRSRPPWRPRGWRY